MFILKALQLLNTPKTFKPWHAGNILSQYSKCGNFFANKCEQDRMLTVLSRGDRVLLIWSSTFYLKYSKKSASKLKSDR